MDRQSLSSLTLEQLKLCQSTLNQRIDDLKFFNLDLGRQNIQLSEQYNVLRQQAEKVKLGKTPKVRRAKSFHKHIYLHNQPKSNQQTTKLTQSNQVNRNNFNFNDLYKLSKNKLSSWIGGKGIKKQQDVVKQQQNQQCYNQQVFYQQPSIQYQQIIYVDCPPPIIIQQDSIVQNDPMQQAITMIISQSPKQIASNNPVKQPDVSQFGNYQQGNQKLNSCQNTGFIGYDRLYNQQDYERYVREQQQRYSLEQQRQSLFINQQKHQNLYDQNLTPKQQIQNEQKKKTNSKNSKNFEFDDLPGIGWKKLKGLIGWGSKKNDNKNQMKNIQSQRRQKQYINPQQNLTPQQHYQHYQPHQYVQTQINYPNQYYQQPHQQIQFKNQQYQNQQYQIIHQQQIKYQQANQHEHIYQENTFINQNQGIVYQRKRTPIFSGTQNYQHKNVDANQLSEQKSMKQQKVQKQQLKSQNQKQQIFNQHQNSFSPKEDTPVNIEQDPNEIGSQQKNQINQSVINFENKVEKIQQKNQSNQNSQEKQSI